MTRHIALVGATASGKSAVAFSHAAEHDDVELISADSMQVYRGMDIGTAKPTPAERAAVPHHLIDVADPSEEFSVAAFKAAATEALEQIESRRHRAILVGGTGLYVRALVDDLEIPGQYPEIRSSLEDDPDTARLHQRLAGLDPVAASRMEPTNRRRIVRALEVSIGSGRPFSSFGPGLESYPDTRFHLIGLRRSRAEIDHRIAVRFRQQMDAGWLDESRTLHARPGGLSRTAQQALGYRELFAHLDGRCTLEEAIDQGIKRTRQFARRQERWFRRDPRIVWLDAADGQNVLADFHERLRD